MALGSVVSAKFNEWQITLPAYIGAMITAGVLRNIDEVTHWFRIDQEQMAEIGSIALEIFIVMALLTLRLWELQNLVLPVFAILIGQTLLTIFLAWFVVFRLMGRGYAGAVMSAGFTGFMLGTTANAMACMGEVVRKFGPAPQAFFVVSIVGAFLIDFINALLINGALNFLR
jgi:ESS family glutamate:Na+ symporter